MSDELENIENVEEEETIPTDNTTEELQENVEQSTGEVSGEVSGEAPEDNSAEIEAEQERLRREHEALLNSFPETTVFYERIIETDTYKVLAGTTRNPYTAELNKCLDNHMDTSELSVVLENGLEKYYIKGYEKPEPTEEEKMLAHKAKIEAQMDALLYDLAKKRGYDDAKSLMTYFNSTKERFRKDALAFNVFRDDLYDKGYEILDKCVAGELDYKEVTLEYILSLIDPLDW